MNDFDELKNKWKNDKADLGQTKTADSEKLVAQARATKNKSRNAQLSTIAILSITLMVLVYFFTEVAPFKEVLSRVGVLLMCGGLLIRIIIEIVSLVKASQLYINLKTDELSKRMVAYYHYRSKIHGAFTITIVALYIIGFYMLTPEFMKYLDMKWIWLMDIGFVFIALTVFYVIRKGVLKELAILREFSAVQNDLNN